LSPLLLSLLSLLLSCRLLSLLPFGLLLSPLLLSLLSLLSLLLSCRLLSLLPLSLLLCPLLLGLLSLLSLLLRCSLLGLLTCSLLLSLPLFGFLSLLRDLLLSSRLPIQLVLDLLLLLELSHVAFCYLVALCSLRRQRRYARFALFGSCCCLTVLVCGLTILANRRLRPRDWRHRQTVRTAHCDGLSAIVDLQFPFRFAGGGGLNLHRRRDVCRHPRDDPRLAPLNPPGEPLLYVRRPRDWRPSGFDSRRYLPDRGHKERINHRPSPCQHRSINRDRSTRSYDS